VGPFIAAVASPLAAGPGVAGVVPEAAAALVAPAALVPVAGAVDPAGVTLAAAADPPLESAGAALADDDADAETVALVPLAFGLGCADAASEYAASGSTRVRTIVSRRRMR
jgi:hypothetical protein